MTTMWIFVENVTEPLHVGGRVRACSQGDPAILVQWSEIAAAINSRAHLPSIDRAAALHCDVEAAVAVQPLVLDRSGQHEIPAIPIAGEVRRVPDGGEALEHRLAVDEVGPVGCAAELLRRAGEGVPVRVAIAAALRSWASMPRTVVSHPRRTLASASGVSASLTMTKPSCAKRCAARSAKPGSAGSMRSPTRPGMPASRSIVLRRATTAESSYWWWPRQPSSPKGGTRTPPQVVTSPAAPQSAPVAGCDRRRQRCGAAAGSWAGSWAQARSSLRARCVGWPIAR